MYGNQSGFSPAFHIIINLNFVSLGGLGFTRQNQALYLLMTAIAHLMPSIAALVIPPAYPAPSPQG